MLSLIKNLNEFFLERSGLILVIKSWVKLAKQLDNNSNYLLHSEKNLNDSGKLYNFYFYKSGRFYIESLQASLSSGMSSKVEVGDALLLLFVFIILRFSPATMLWLLLMWLLWRLWLLLLLFVSPRIFRSIIDISGDEVGIVAYTIFLAKRHNSKESSCDVTTSMCDAVTR